jgi:uncharacterized protein (TIGR03437 family)
VGQPLPEGIIAFKLVDAYGLPVSGAAVTWAAQVIGSSVTNADKATDAYGIAAAEPILGPTARSYTFTGSAGGRSITFSGNARLVPTIAANGVVDSASFSSGRAVAPGSYISIFGSALSDYTDVETSARLPLAIDYVNVSFDVPSAGISVPGRLVYVSPTQVNVQVPWELQGQTSAQMKVTIDYSVGNVVKVSLADYAPAFFETSPGVVAALDASNAVIGSGNAARRGQVIQVFANGLGPVTNQPASGEPAQADPNLSRTTTQPVVTIGGHTATVSFSGLTPTLPGLYQLNVVVPPDLTAGTWPISVTIGGKSSPSASLPVQ